MARRKGRRRFWKLVGIALLTIVLLLGVTVAPVALLGRVPPPLTSFMWLAQSEDPATGWPCDHVAYEWVDRVEISPELPLAVVLAEDQRFRLHRGFDLKSIRKAVKERAESGRVRGASTITQQVAKNLFLWPGKSYLRKGLEAWFTVWIELLWPKRRILEVYLNVAQFGPCVFGAEAASQRFFERRAADLEPEQAALLAAVLPDPYKLRAHNPGPYCRERTAEIQELMEEQRGAWHLRGL